MDRRVVRRAIAVALVLVTVAAGVAAASVRAPRSGATYTGPSPNDAFLRVSGRSVAILALSFRCGDVSGRTSLNDLRLKRTSRGYRFNADANGNVTYSDDQPDENARVHVSGRFSESARTVRGHIRVRSARCGDTGNLRWRASR